MKMTMPTTTDLRLGRHPSRPERLAIMDAAGNARHWFGIETTVEEAQEALALAKARLAAPAKEESAGAKSRG